MTIKNASLVAALAQGASLMASLARVGQLAQYQQYPMLVVAWVTGIVTQATMLTFLLTVYMKTETGR